MRTTVVSAALALMIAVGAGACSSAPPVPSVRASASARATVAHPASGPGATAGTEVGTNTGTDTGTDTGTGSDTADGLGLPIQAYLLTDAQQYELTRVQNIYITKCMKSFGFGYVPRVVAPQHGAASAANMPRRYGVSDPALVAKYGYHIDTQPPAPDPHNDVTDLSDAEYEVLWGHSKVSNSDAVTSTSNGTSIPAGGCMAQSRRDFAAAMFADPSDTQPIELPQQINVQSFERSQSDPRVTAVIAAWSKCMAASGYRIDSPLDAAAPFTGPLPASAAEIAEAKADLACKASTHLIRIWDAVETEIQNKMIAQNHAALAAILQAKQQELTRAARLLGR